MSSSLDVSLDDLIKNNKKSASGGGFRGRGRGSGPGPARSFPNRSGNRSSPYSTGRAMVPAPDAVWQHNMYSDSMAAPPFAAAQAMSIETGTKLYISNLEYGVSNEDIKELFSEVGDLKRYSIHYDRSGRSKGTAEIVFSREGDALAAVKRYNNVQLDGKPMKIEIVGRNIVTPAPMPPTIFGRNGIPRSGPGRGGPMTQPQPMARPRGGGRGFGRGGRGRGRGGGRGSEKVSAEALDADLEKYHTESMQMN